MLVTFLSNEPWLSSETPAIFPTPGLVQPHFKPRKIQWSPSTMMKNNLEAMGFGINWPLPQLYMTQTGSCLWTCLYKSKPWVWHAVPIPIQQTPVVTNCTMEVWLRLGEQIAPLTNERVSDLLWAIVPLEPAPRKTLRNEESKDRNTYFPIHSNTRFLTPRGIPSQKPLL